MTELIARALAWVLRLLTPTPRGKHGIRAERTPRRFEPRKPKPTPRRSVWRDFVPPTPADDDPPLEDSAAVVRPYLMTPEELAEWRRQSAEAEAAEQQRQQQARLAELTEATRRPVHDWTVAARAAGVMA
ncbi:hypothetical protein [Embleya sp. NPDC005575]|uniref:hypothetical protein n=1 Tax=Embleya sp. NPDC005575 TaxID=3156892 RepID=UPI0033B6D684